MPEQAKLCRRVVRVKSKHWF